MESDLFGDPNYSNVQGSMTTPPTGPSVAVETGSMFNNAHNTYIASGSFRITNINTLNGPLATLHRRTAPHAILNAGGRADEVRCHPGTREEVIGRIEKWRDAQDGLTPPIFWLSGPAGAGKSAIVQTIAERCKAQGVSQANFFFFRTDASRNSLSPLVATLVHQLILLYPPSRDPVETVLSTNPLIFDSVLEDQLMQLIVTPLQAIRQSSLSYHPPLLLIDGLDECESEDKHRQRQIIRAFDKVLAEHSCLFHLLVASRDESQIRAAFNEISSALLPLYLDDQYSPEKDIRSFVNDEFKRVRKTHPLAHTLDATWPSIADVEDIVWKSSGQFIYAATVMRFISHSSASPTISLARVHGAAQISANPKSPFSHLDTVYTYILSQVDDQEALKDVLHAQIFLQEHIPKIFHSDVRVQLADGPKLLDVLQPYNPKYTEGIVHSCLADLTSIAQYTQFHDLLFHHASFPDYLLDQSRSRRYFVDIESFNLRIQPAVWKACRELEEDIRPPFQKLAIAGLSILRQLPPGFLKTLTTQDLLLAGKQGLTPYFSTSDQMKHIYSLCACDDDVNHYRQLVREWICTRPDKYLRYCYISHGEQPDNSQWPPFSHRYLAMVYIEDHVTTEPHGWIDLALRPDTDSSARETASWLKDLLHRIHRENSAQEYNRLLQKWTTWATWKDIPLDGIGDLPNARRYLRQSRVEKWVTSRLKIGSRPE